MIRRVRRGAAVMGATVIAASLLVTPALAGSDLLTPTGVIAAGGNIGPRHSLTNVHGVGWDSREYTCVNAINDDDNTYAGQSICAPAGSLASHDYCGCRLRHGFVYPSYPYYTESGTAFQDW